MEPMDIDEVTVVPDSPDESSKQNIIRLGGFRSQNISNKYNRNLTTNGNIVNSRKINPPRGIIRSGRSGNHASSLPIRCGDSSSYKGLLVRKQGTDNDVSLANKNSDNECCISNKKPFITSQSSNSPDKPVVDLIGCSKEPVNLSKSNLGVTQAGEFKEGSASEDARSSWSRDNSYHMLRDGGENRMLNNVVIVDSSPDSVHRPGNHYCPRSALLKSDCINSPKPSRQKRLVRNGCISPMNIAKGKQAVEKNHSGSRDMDKSDYLTTSDTSLNDRIPMKNSGDYNSRSLKGKEVIVKNSDGNRQLFETRTSAGINEKANVYSANRGTVLSFSGSNGWRTPRGQSSRQTILSPLSCEVQHIPIDDHSPHIVGQAIGNKALRRDNNDDGSTVHLGINDLVSNTCPSRQTSGQPGGQCSRTSGRSHMAHNAFAKRQKQGSTLSTHAECSRSAADDSEIVEISSYSKDSMPRFANNVVGNGVGNVGPVIDIDEVTPERQHNTSHSTGRSFRNEDAVATQVELDERLAKELQEQFYNEEFTSGTNEQTDAHIALRLQQEEASHRTISRGRRTLSNPVNTFSTTTSQEDSKRGSSSGRFSSRYPLNLGRSGANARAPAPSRITMMRNAFRGTPHTLSSSRGRNSNIRSTRQGNSLFPPGMDVETRMRILETLESFNDMGVGNSFLQMQRDFNENDYESLLALDENNHEHAGATARQISGLPESTVQTESLEEACSICLDNPAMGDVIRHLPCLHKFHKDCIDPWLRRRSSCPVCKSSIT